MHCPNDNTVLQMTTREGIEIDYCPTCRGVWLDRGELDKLIERATSYGAGAPAQPQQFGVSHDRHSQPQQQSNQQYRPYDDDDDHRGGYHEGGHHNNQGHHKKKKEGFLGDLFDF